MDEYPPSETETDTQASFGFKLDAFIPLTILSISFIILLGWQVSVSSTQRKLLQDTITRGQPAANQAQQVQTTVAKLAGDLLAAAQTDGTAKAIADKFKIQQNGAPEPTSAASPAGPQ